MKIEFLFPSCFLETRGASNNPCLDNYAGPYAESEPEIAAFTKFYESVASQVKLYFAFHSYGQFIMVPFGHTFVIPPNYYELMTIGLKGKDAISTRYGTQYVVGSIADVMCTLMQLLH